MNPSGPRVFISCGEASGDLYASALVRALRQRAPGLTVTGFGGPRLASEGAELVGTYDGLTVTGLTEALFVLRRSFQMLGRIEAAARAQRPDVFVAIDFPDFNFRLLPRMRSLGIPIVYYISPQLWAWRPRRIETIKKFVDKMLVIFPFEEEIYRKAGVPVEFVGHPLIELAHADQPRDAFLRANGLDPARPVVALLPGSRPNEIRHVLPTLQAAVPKIAAAVPGVQFLIARAPGLDDALFEVERRPGLQPGRSVVVTGAADNVLSAADVVITASGTATVQTALHEKPMVIVYRVSPLTYAIGKRLVGVTTFGMVNLVAGRKIVTELIQDAFTPDAVANEAITLLTSPARMSAMHADLIEMKARLGGVGATSRAADAILAAARR
ncbi:MAG: lipid-A-disaccharide synthase [Acidobacteria bacterium]|nr:MAG: lipid-A-disaccharide synthase [Acidobacteriota bacterium]